MSPLNGNLIGRVAFLQFQLPIHSELAYKHTYGLLILIARGALACLRSFRIDKIIECQQSFHSFRFFAFFFRELIVNLTSVGGAESARCAGQREFGGNFSPVMRWAKCTSARSTHAVSAGSGRSFCRNLPTARVSYSSTVSWARYRPCPSSTSFPL